MKSGEAGSVHVDRQDLCLDRMVAIDFDPQPGRYGTRVTVRADLWRSGAAEALRDAKVRELVVAPGLGAFDLDFVAELPWIERLAVFSISTLQWSGLQSLSKLRSLEIHALRTVGRLDVSCFPQLRHLVAPWWRGGESVFACRRLEELSIRYFPMPDLAEFRGLQKLRSLELLQGGLQASRGVASAADLERLRFGMLTRLSNLDGFEQLRKLRSLTLQSCRKIRTLERLAGLRRLEELVLDDVGQLESVRPLARLHALRKLNLVGDTNVMDGDLRPIAELPHIDSVVIRGRRHYSHVQDGSRLRLRTG